MRLCCTNGYTVLSRLVCASLNEDKYGVVQRDIPKIIEALLSFLTAVEEAEQELVKESATAAKAEEREELDRARDVLAPLRDSTSPLVVLTLGLC